MSEAPRGGQDSRPGEDPRPDTGRESHEDAYTWYRRGLELLGRGSAAAAAQLLGRAAEAEPASRSVLEALGRAQFDAGRYTAAAESFRRIVEASPSDDYAQFGLGLALARSGNPAGAAEHLALAAAMRPELRHYTDALRGVRATLRARNEARAAGQAGADPQARAPGHGRPGTQDGGRPGGPGHGRPGGRENRRTAGPGHGEAGSPGEGRNG